MPVPKMKVSRSRRNKRSANKNITMHPVSECQTCRAPLASHQVCQGCGYYKGSKILRTKFERLHERGKSRAAQFAAAQSTAQPAESAE
ncbi:MAG: large subunit ribosomal protein [Candidatus Dependentiae bacterium]|nr:large subunit ribosomal protein [Candidatus Dependentiae bacterium]